MLLPDGIEPVPNPLERVLAGESLALLNGVPQGYLEAVYAEAYDLMQEELFESAIDPFHFLVTHSPYDFRFQFGYGLCMHQIGRIHEALKHYGVAWILDPGDPACAFRLGECHATLGNRKVAQEAFEASIQLCAPPAFNAELRLAAEKALQSLNE